MVLVLGIGNDILKDDGIGIKLVNDLRLMDFPAGIRFETTLLGGLETLEIIKGYDKVIIVDAIKTENGIPGEIRSYNPSFFRNTLHLSNLHDINFLTSLELAKKIGIDVTEDITIITIEILEDREFGITFSPEIEEKYPEILEKTRSLILLATE
jgi:hydrogenase maturation protease